jgi:hypothetical protein
MRTGPTTGRLGEVRLRGDQVSPDTALRAAGACRVDGFVGYSSDRSLQGSLPNVIANNETSDACARLEEALRGLGFAPARAPGKWSGRYDGRDWTVHVSPQRRTYCRGEIRTRVTQGYRLRINAGTVVPMRAYFVESRFADVGLVRMIYRWRRFASFPLEIEGLEPFRGVASDADWLRSLLAEPRAAASLLELVEHRERHGDSASVYFDPEQLSYCSPLLAADAIDAPRTLRCIDALVFLAREAEKLPPPAQPARLSAFERYGRAHPALAALLFFAAVLGALAILTLLGVAAVFSVLLLTRASS